MTATNRTATNLTATNPTTVNLAAFSLHRYEQVVGHLAKAGVLGRFYYAHRRSLDGKRLGIGTDRAVNAWPAAYLAGAHMRWAPPADPGRWYGRYAALWQEMVLRRWRPADILHTVIGYSATRLMERARTDGAPILAHVVTPHFGHQLELEREEWAALGLTQHGRRWTMTPEQSRQYDLADAFMVDSQFSRKTLINAGIAPRQITVIPPGITSPPTATSATTDGTAGGSFRVLVAARLDPVKGHRYLLDAWKTLRLPQAELVFVGGVTAVTPRILAGYDGLYRHIPHSSPPDVAALMRQASVVVLPSVCDGWGQTVVEALACGTPVIVTGNVGAADCIEDGVNGLVVPARNAQALAEALERLYRDRDLRDAMADNALKSVAQIGGWDRYADRLVQLYASLRCHS